MNGSANETPKCSGQQSRKNGPPYAASFFVDCQAGRGARPMKKREQNKTQRSNRSPPICS